MENLGWVKMHRKLLDSKYGKNIEMLGFWTYLILNANHKDNYDNEGNLIKKGTFKTGRKKISLETGLSESKVERFLKKLEIEQQIEQQKLSKYRIISICNWVTYQVIEQQIEQQVNNKRTTSEQQVNTNNNEKNEKNEKNIYIVEKQVSSTAKKIVEYLNFKTDKNYKASSRKTIRLINARIAEGFTQNDFTTVIDNKCSDWLKDENMNKFLRPETLFGTKFEGYLNMNKTVDEYDWLQRENERTLKNGV